MPDLPTDPSGALSRRSVLGLGLAAIGAAAGVSACTVDTPVTRRRQASGPRPLAPDVRVAVEALAAIRTAGAQVAATAARFPALAPSLAALTALHQVHERSLADAVPVQARASASPAPYAVPGRRPVAVARLSAAEQHLHATLDALALRAQSGEFARLLASMGASVLQHHVGLSA